MAGVTIALIRDRTAEVSEKLRREARDQQTRTAERIRDRAKAIVPVRTGRLRASIAVDAGRATGIKPEGFRPITIGASAPYASFVEEGTRYMAARPYLRPAAEAERWPYQRAFTPILRGLA